MGLGSLFGSKPKKPKASENEKTLGRVSQDMFRRWEDAFAPRLDDLDRESRVDKSATLRGRSNADVMQSMGSPSGVDAKGRLPSAVSTGTRALGSALTGGSNQAVARQRDLTKGVMDTALGAAQSSVQGLSTAASISSNEAIQKMRIDMENSRQLGDIIGSAAGGAMAYGMNYSPKTPNMQGGAKNKPTLFARSR